MNKTPFSGLTVLEPGDNLDSDSGAFTGRDREVIDHFLRMGAKLHRHTGKAGLANPTMTPSATIIASGGTIDPEQTISLGYTLEDGDGGETMLSPLSVVTTGAPLSIPVAAPSAAIDYTGGSLETNTYYYGLTWIDGDGGETPLGPTVEVERAPGYASGRVQLSNLNYGMAGEEAVGWRLYRAIGGGTFDYLASGTVALSTFTDDGTTSPLCDIHPPLDEENTTRQVNTLLVALPTADGNMASATMINLYLTVSGDFGGASLLDSYPIASAGQSATYASIELQDRTPPDVNLSVGGANQIDPDSELLDWHWKRPVAASANLGSGVLGDVKLVENNGYLYAVLAPLAVAAGPGEWTRIGSATAVGGTTLTASGSPGSVAEVTDLLFTASGGASVSVTQEAPGKALITIAAPKAGGGGGISTASGAGGTVEGAEKETFIEGRSTRVSVGEGEAAEAQVTIAGPERAWASASLSLSSGAQGSALFDIGAFSGHLLRISTDKRARVRVYGDSTSRVADTSRAIGTDPVGDHGVQLDYANTAHPSGGIGMIAPAVHAINLAQSPTTTIYLTVDNYDIGGTVTVAFQYMPMEG